MSNESVGFLSKTLLGMFIFSCSSNAATFQVLSELNFRSFLPLTGSCEMDFDSSVVSDLPGSIMCMGNQVGTKGQYRIIGDRNKDFEIIIRQRRPKGGDGFTYTPAGKIVSTVDNITIVLDQIHTVNTGNGGFIDINLAGQVIVTNVFTPGMGQSIESDEIIAWEKK